MSNNEILFLCLVLGGFAAFAITIAAGTIVDRTWARNEARKNPPRDR